MPNTERRVTKKRIKIDNSTWIEVLERAQYRCEWEDNGVRCNLKEGDIDQVGGGRVKLTPDHVTPHSVNYDIDPTDASKWQALCGRHQVIKKNYWNQNTGKINVYAIVQAASEAEKREVYEFLKDYFND